MVPTSFYELLTMVSTATLSLPSGYQLMIGPYLLAVGVFSVLTIGFWLVRSIVLAHLVRLSKRTNTDIDDAIIAMITGIRPWVYTIIALYVALETLSLPETVQIVVTVIALSALVWQVIQVALALVQLFTGRIMEREALADGTPDPNTVTIANLITLIARIGLWSFGILFVLSNLGIEITSLIAGLGIGGIAIAFALQGILSDLFASFSIYFDKPFRIGDFIIVGADMGTVERIGIKSTRLRTLQGEELVISNAELTTARVQNFKKMQERRIKMTFGVTYDTTETALIALPQYIKAIFATLDGARLDRAHFQSFGDSALIFEVIYFVESSDYAVFMDIQQAYNLALLKTCREQGINFAFPTQTIHTIVQADLAAK